MSHLCTICRNHTDSPHYVRLYDDSYEEIFKDNLFQIQADFKYVHPACAAFFPETELLIINSVTNPCLLKSKDQQVVTETIICNYKNLTNRTNQSCLVCSESLDSKEILLPCLAGGCNIGFHLACIVDRLYIGRIKLAKTGGAFFKYGLLCPVHNEGLKHNQAITLESGIYEIFRVLDVPTLNEELATFEQMFTNINTRIQDDEFLKNVLEALTLQNLPIPPKTRKNRAIKKSTYKAKDRDEEGETKTPAKGENGHARNGEEKSAAGTEIKSTPRKRQRSRKLEDNMTKEDQIKEKKKRLRLRKRTRAKPKTISQIIESLTVPNPNKPAVEIDIVGEKNNQAPDDTHITLRKKQTGNALNYNLRGEIKVNSKSKFDFLHDFSAPKKHKTKTATDSNKLLTTEEKKKVYWNEFNELYFRKPYTEEAELLMPNALHDIVPVIQSEVQTANAGGSPLLAGEEEDFSPSFEAYELMALAKASFLPTIFNQDDSLKVLLEFTNNNDETATTKKHHNLMAYFRMKKKAQTEMPIPEDLTDVKAFNNPKYEAVSSSAYHQMKEAFLNGLKPLNYDSGFKFHDSLIDEMDLSTEAFHKLFGLKHIEYLTPEDTLEIKSKIMFEKEMTSLEEEKVYDSGIDELSKEILYTEYLMNNFVVNENNTKKSKLTYKLKENDAFLKSEKFQERTRKLESDSKLQVIKKYFQEGVKDKTSNFVTRGYVRNNKDQIVSALTFVPKVDKDTNVIRISREVKHLSLVETDCCVCFCNLFTEYNPIIYCSNCNASFHKFCYGLAELPSEDFFCDICLATNDPSARKVAKGSSKNKKNVASSSFLKAKPTNTNPDIKCGLCGIEDYPLKKYRKNDWYHITCLVMHDMTQYKNGEWQIKQEKNNVLEQIKIEGPQFECSLCKNKTGIVVKCEDQKCKKHFHAMCAYVSGYAMELLDYDDHKDDKAKNGLRPIIHCPDHTDDPDRNTLKQQYFRRYTTNFRNCLNYETWEEYEAHLAVEEEMIKTEDVSNSQTPMVIETITNGHAQELQNEIAEFNPLTREAEVPVAVLESDFDSGPSKKVKSDENQNQ